MGGKFCRSGINCRGGLTVRGTKNPILLGFRGGMALADQSVSKQQPRDAAFFGVPLCCSPLAPRRP
jgi:hypothetical protein